MCFGSKHKEQKVFALGSTIMGSVGSEYKANKVCVLGIHMTGARGSIARIKRFCPGGMAADALAEPTLWAG